MRLKDSVHKGGFLGKMAAMDLFGRSNARQAQAAYDPDAQLEDEGTSVGDVPASVGPAEAWSWGRRHEASMSLSDGGSVVTKMSSAPDHSRFISSSSSNILLLCGGLCGELYERPYNKVL